MLAQKASGLGRPCKAIMPETRSEATQNVSLNQAPLPRTVTAFAALFNTSPLSLRVVSAAQGDVSPAPYHTTRRRRVHLFPFVAVGLLGLAALYLIAHMAAALLGWRDTAAIATLTVWAWAMHSLWTGARR